MRGEVHIAHIIHELERHRLLPAIVFRTSRNQCDIDAQRSATNRSLRIPAEEQRKLRLMIHEVMARYEMDHELITTHPHYNALVSTAIGAHHAGQLLMWRLLLEELMARGVLRVLVATGTVAAGVDFPARTVVITALSRRGAEGFASLTATEFQQMSGRAGRRGKDAVGFCIAAPGPFCDGRMLSQIAKQPPEPLASSYFPSPSTVLNLLRYRNVDDLRFTVERSLASFVDKKQAKALLEEADTLEKEIGASEKGIENVSQEVSHPEPSDRDDSGEDESDEEFEGSSARKGTSRQVKKLRKKVKRLRRQAEEFRMRQLSLLDSSFTGLHQLGYIQEMQLSEKGYWAANLCTSLVLELAEIIESKMLENVSAEYLVSVVSSIAGDAHRKYLNPKKQSLLSGEDIERLTAIVSRVRATAMPGIVDTLSVLPGAAYTVVTWMHAESWQEFRSLLFLSGVAEGDAARLITQTIDHLNQLTRLYKTHSALALRAEEAKRRISRPPLTEAIDFDAA